MKTIIISDIKGNSRSVIPYGLELAKSVKSDVEIVHVTNPEKLKTKDSPYSDTASVASGQTLSDGEIRQKHINMARSEIDEFLTSENIGKDFPNKLNIVVEINSIEKEIEKRVERDKPQCIVVINAEPDKYIFRSRNMICNLIKKLGTVCFLIPPGNNFKEYEKVLLPVDFNSGEVGKYTDINFFLGIFKPLVNTVGVANWNEYLNLEIKSKAWQKIAKHTFLPSVVKTNVIEGKDFTDTLTGYILKNDPDLVILIHDEKNPLNNNFKKELAGIITEQTDTPVLFYYRK